MEKLYTKRHYKSPQKSTLLSYTTLVSSLARFYHILAKCEFISYILYNRSNLLFWNLLFMIVVVLCFWFLFATGICAGVNMCILCWESVDVVLYYSLSDNSSRSIFVLLTEIKFMLSYLIASNWMQQDTFDYNSTFVQVKSIGVNWPQCVKSIFPELLWRKLNGYLREITFINIVKTVIPASNYIHCEVWDEIIYPFPNFNGCTFEAWDRISNFNSHFSGNVITYPCWD